MKEAAEPVLAPTPAAPAPAIATVVPTGAPDVVLSMQRTVGNRHVTRLLTDQRTAWLSRMPIRKGAGKGSLAEAESADIFEAPDDASKKVGTLAKGKTVDLTSEEPGYYGVIADGQKGYVKSSELATAIDELPAAKDAEFAARAKTASDAMDAAGHLAGKALRGQGTAPSGSGGALPDWFRQLQFKLSMVTTWANEEEDAQQVLDDYLTFYMQAWHGDLPPSVKYLFQYAGRSSINQASAAKGGFGSVGKFGGGINDKGKPNPNWCTQTSSSAIVNALKEMGYAPTVKIEAFLNNIGFQKVNGAPNTVSGSAAFSAPLFPGDQVMYLFDGCQYGGHTVTVVDDLGASFLHISGNTGDAIAVGVGEAKRLTSEPKVKAGGAFKLAECNKVGTAEERDASTAYIKGLDFGGKVLTYSIIRDSAFFAEIESIPELGEDQQAKLLQKYKLQRISVST
ncbi:SH3 domain-containing protein [Solirubrobacter soli]|uniref:SH3 domain-containing protein n=1 Tax=Solirubrobacter soli TaxID=363832 RepID=UPI00041761DE|nr:SH3 domain-containing protein [Solirubrobacter soli]